jgi:hypothetical protein
MIISIITTFIKKFELADKTLQTYAISISKCFHGKSFNHNSCIQYRIQDLQSLTKQYYFIPKFDHLSYLIQNHLFKYI